MADEVRPDPGKLPGGTATEGHRRSGTLKVFFGMCAGVGKTFAMLREVRARRREGTDAVVGIAETHGRPETAALLEGCEIVPPRMMDCRGVPVGELDADAVLARRPALVVVDELAHANVPGSRNAKRWQDVFDFLDSGIDVYTAMNIQHLESFADAVEQLSGTAVTERVPDSVLDRADEIVLIDLPPGDLLKRLDEGKVYTGGTGERARESFFTRPNLAALREMALSHTARLVDRQLTTYLRARNRSGPYRSSLRYLVAVSPSPNSEYLIRWTRRAAFTARAEWLAVTVETSRPLSERDRSSLAKNLSLARQLGAEVATIPSNDVAGAIVDFARRRNVTRLVVGKSGYRSHRFFLFRPTVTDRLVKGSGDIDVIIVRERGARQVRPPRARVPPSGRSLRDAGVSVAVVACVAILGEVIAPVAGYRAVSFLFLAAIIGVGLFADRFAALAAAAASAATWDFLFIPPRLTFRIGSLDDVLMFGAYFIVALGLGYLTTRNRADRRMLTERERRISLLFDFSQELAEERELDKVVQSSLAYIGDHFDAEAVIYLRDEAGVLGPAAFRDLRNRNAAAASPDAGKEYGVARWCFDRKATCGRFTDILSGAAFHYVPLLTPGGGVGVFGVRPRGSAAWLPAQEEFLLTMTRTLALSVERELLVRERQKALVNEESDRLSRILLNSISHELRTPLTMIKGSVSALIDTAAGNDPGTRRELLSDTLQAADKLNMIVENLLSMNRLESGKLRLKRIACDLGDFLGAAVASLSGELRDHPLTVAKPDEPVIFSADYVLLLQVMVNIVRNAVSYTPAGTPIDIVARSEDRDLVLAVEDRGPGVPDAELPRLFEKFFRGANAPGHGTGLGLSICKGIVEAHGGSIAAANRKPVPGTGGMPGASLRGLAVTLRLPGAIVPAGAPVPGGMEDEHGTDSRH